MIGPWGRHALSASLKFDHPPLLAPGRHYVDLVGVENLCVRAFDDRRAREALFFKFEEAVQAFARAMIPCEFWIDGSFVTRKMDPKDVDLAIKIDVEVSDALTPTQLALVDRANSEHFIDGVDSFVFVSYPRDHVLFSSAGNEKESWAEQWGLEHSERWLKGMLVLRLGETSVGLRIRR